MKSKKPYTIPNMCDSDFEEITSTLSGLKTEQEVSDFLKTRLADMGVAYPAISHTSQEMLKKFDGLLEPDEEKSFLMGIVWLLSGLEKAESVPQSVAGVITAQQVKAVLKSNSPLLNECMTADEYADAFKRSREKWKEFKPKQPHLYALLEATSITVTSIVMDVLAKDDFRAMLKKVLDNHDPIDLDDREDEVGYLIGSLVSAACSEFAHVATRACLADRKTVEEIAGLN